MSEDNLDWKIRVQELISEIKEGIDSLENINKFYEEACLQMADNITERKKTDAVILTECYVNFYTCLETIFFSH